MGNYKSTLNRYFIPITLIIYAIVISIGNFYHEPWRDELQMWAGSIHSDNFIHFLKIRSLESHPILFDFILYIISLITHDFLAVKLFNITCCILAAWLILKHSPFPNYQKLGILFSYYFIFEFSLISRSYALGLLLFLLFIICIEKRKINLAIVFAILAANTNILIAICIASIFFYSWLAKKVNIKQLILVSIGLLIALLDVYYQTFVNWDYTTSTQIGIPVFDWYWITAKLTLIYKGFIPLPQLTTIHFWNTNIISDLLPENVDNILGSLLSVLLLVFIYLRFKKDKYILISIGLGYLLLLVLFGFFWGGSQRHWGHFYLLFLAFYWLDYSNKTNKNLILSVIISAQVLAGIYAFTMDIKHPFSNSKNVANYLKENYDLNNILITSETHYLITPVIIQISDTTQFYNIKTGTMESYTNWNNPLKLENKTILKTLKNSIIIEPINDVKYLNTIKFDNAIVEDENYYLKDAW